MDRYRWVCNLGDGTFGEVYKAMHRSTGAVVAVKRLKQSYSSMDECLKLPEVKALTALRDHKNIMHLNELVFQNNRFFFVFEYMDNSLDDLIMHRKKPFAENKIRAWMQQLLIALRFMHSQGFVHRDLKPENLLLCKRASVIKVADLGLATEMVPEEPLSGRVGTLWYEAPEVLLMGSGYGAPVDMWAAGLIMAELFSLRPLMADRNKFDQFQKMCDVMGAPLAWPDGMERVASLGLKVRPMPPTPSVLLLIPNASAEARDLISSMLSWDPKRRPTAAAALQHPFFQNHKVPKRAPMFGRKGCHPAKKVKELGLLHCKCDVQQTVETSVARQRGVLA